MHFINLGHVENEQSRFNNCIILPQSEGTLMSMEHWYKPGTNCTYLLQGKASQGYIFLKSYLLNWPYIFEISFQIVIT